MGKNFFRSFFIERALSQKGVTLSELLAAIAVLAIVSIPFMGSFISAVNNNVSSKDKVYTSVLAQKAMDDIKSRPVFLEAEAGRERKIYSSDAPYRVEYVVTEEQNGVMTPDTSEYDFDISNMDFNQEFTVGQNSVAFNGYSYSLSDGSGIKKYYLRLKEDTASGRCNYVFYDGMNVVLQSGELTAGADINEKVSFEENGAEKFELHVIIDPSVDKNVNLYVIDDFNSRLILLNDSEKELYQYYYALSRTRGYSNTLYRIEITVYKGTEITNTLVSYVKK